MNATTAINAYSNVSLESSVIGADPHELISILYQGAILEVSSAKSAIQRKELAIKGKSISKAISIIGEGLNACLDKTIGGELAQNLSSLYDYMVARLVEANLKNDVLILDEVASLLNELKGAWEAIRPQAMQYSSTKNTSANSKRAYASA